MRLNTLIALAVLMLCTAAQVYAGKNVALQIGQPTIDDAIDLSTFHVSRNIPATYDLSRTLYGTHRILRGSGNISETIASREKAYTMEWIRKALTGEMAPGLLEDKIVLVRQMNGKDDGSFLAYSIPTIKTKLEPISVEIIDGRNLTVLIRKPGISKASVADLAHQFINYVYFEDENRLELVALENHQIDASRAYGKMEVQNRTGTGWFTIPFEWYRDGEAILFLFQKIASPPASKLPIPAEKVIGGLPTNDPRTLYRFENSNRKELAAEYVKRMHTEKQSR